MNIYKSFSVYLGASLIQRGIAFFILPIFTFYLGPGDFGMLSLLTTLFVFTSPVIALGTTSAISVAFFNENQADYASYVSSSLLVPLVISSSITLLSILFGQYFSVLLGVPQIWLSLIPIFSFMSVIIMTMLIDYQVKKESIKYGVFSISNSVLNTVLSLFLVIGLGMNYQGRLIGQYFSIFLFTIIALILLYRRGLLTSKISLRFIKDSLIFGLPIVPHVIGGLVINMSDKIFINQLIGKSELGIYNIGYVIGATVAILTTSFARSIVPFSYELFTKGDNLSKEKVVKVYWIYFFALGLVVISLSFLAPYLFDWFIDKQYSRGAAYVKWIAFGNFFHGCYLLFANIIFYTKRTKVLSYYSIVNIILSLGLNYFLINKLGTIGAAYSFCICSFINFISIGIIARNFYPLPLFYFLKKTS